MNNNDVLKKLRVALELRDDDIIEILRLVKFEISKSELSAFFRKEDHPNYKDCGDQVLRYFLNGLIIYKRGPMHDKEKPQPIHSKPSFQKDSDKRHSNHTKPSYKKRDDKPSPDKQPELNNGDKPMRRRVKIDSVDKP